MREIKIEFTPAQIQGQRHSCEIFRVWRLLRRRFAFIGEREIYKNCLLNYTTKHVFRLIFVKFVDCNKLWRKKMKRFVQFFKVFDNEVVGSATAVKSNSSFIIVINNT